MERHRPWRSLRANLCFRTFITTDGSPFSGSLIKRWKCSGMITYPYTTNFIALLGFLQDPEKAVATACRTQDRQAMIATAGDEVQVACAVIPVQSLSHEDIVTTPSGCRL